MPVTTDSGREILSLNLQTECFSKAAMEVTTDLGPCAVPVEESRQSSASVCELYRETIQLGLSRGRNAMGIWQDLVDGYLLRDRDPIFGQDFREQVQNMGIEIEVRCTPRSPWQRVRGAGDWFHPA